MNAAASIYPHFDQLEPFDQTSVVSTSVRSNGWLSVIEELRGWQRSTPLWDEEDFLAPSASLLRTAVELAFWFRSQSFAEPLRVLPDGEGGIVFEREGPGLFESILVTDDLQIELRRFAQGRLLAPPEVVRVQDLF